MLTNDTGKDKKLLRLENVKQSAAGIHRIGQRHVKNIVRAIADEIGRDRDPLARRLCEIRAPQQIKCPAELTGGVDLEIGFGGNAALQHRL
jgi:hypothetical protein